MKIFIPMVIAAILLSCASQRKSMDALIGMSKPDVLERLGFPVRQESDGATGEILMFSKLKNKFDMTRPGSSYYEYTFIHLDHYGKVTSWRIENIPNPPDQVNLTLYAR